MKIEIDGDSYPTEDSLRILHAWRGTNVAEVLDAVADYFERCGYGSAETKPGYWRLATGGWSGCEEVIASLPPLVHSIAWQSSHRGGLHIYALER